MRAIVLAYAPVTDASERNHAAAMLPLLDRPMVQHVVEQLVRQGVRKIDFILSAEPHQIEEHLGDGSAWGARFRYHLTPGDQPPTVALRAIDLSGDTMVTLARAKCLLRLMDGDLRDASESGVPTLFVSEQDNATGGSFRGWACLPAQLLAEAPCDDEASFEEYIRILASESGQTVSRDGITVGSYEQMLHANRRLLEEGAAGLMVHWREAGSGIRLGRNVYVHPSAEIVAPVFIGPNSRVGRNAVVGPFAVIGASSVVSRGTFVRRSVVLPGTFLGPYLEFDGVAVDAGTVVAPGLDAHVKGGEYLFSGPSYAPLRISVLRLAERLTALLLLAVGSPLLLLMVLWRTVKGMPAFRRDAVVRLPAMGEQGEWPTFEMLGFASLRRSGESLWHHALYRLLPGLVHVMRGECRLVGLPPRTMDEVVRLPQAWRNLYIGGEVGLVDEALVRYGSRATREEKFASDAFQLTQRSFRHSTWILLGFAWRMATEAVRWLMVGRRPADAEDAA
ncbi:MAG: NDP-sugar synthase [Bryobacteraceae bacterium]